jgi:hypothetical protein
VLEVVAPHGCERSLKGGGPLLVCLGEPPHLIRGQIEVAEHRLERLAAVDGVEELLPYVGRESLLRSARPRALWSSLWPCRQRVQWHPVCQPALVPCRAMVTTQTLATRHVSPRRVAAVGDI